MPRPSVETERRSQILASTCKVISYKGIGTLRVADVAKDAGVSSGIIHYYFDNKRDLIRAAFEYSFRHSLERRMAIFESELEPLEKLRTLVDAYLPEEDETIEAWHVWVGIWDEALHDQELRELNDQVYGEWRSIVAGIIHDVQVSEQLADTDPVDVANMLIGLLDGLALQVLAGSHSMTLKRMQATCQSFIDGITA